MEKYTNNKKNFNRKSIFERISEFREQKSRIQKSIDILNDKIEILEIKYAIEFHKNSAQFSDEKCAELRRKINHYHNELSDYEKQLEDLNPVAKSLKKSCLKIGATIVAGSFVIGLVSSSLKRPDKDNVITEPTTSFSEQTKESTTQDRYSHLDSSTAILKDLKQRFIDDYNQKHGTSISANSIEFIGSNLNHLYKTYDGQYVTHGNSPYETEKMLNSYGNYELIGTTNNSKVYQILINGTPLESYAIASYKDSSGKVHSINSPVLSGNDLDTLLENLENKSGLSENILGKMSPLPEYVSNANVNYHDNSTKMYYVEEYQKAAKELDNKKEIPTTQSPTQEHDGLDYDKLVETVAPKFIDLYAKSDRTPEEQKQLENYAAEIISKTNFLEKQLFERLNNQELEKLNSGKDDDKKIDEIVSVDAYLFNYTSGSYNPAVSYNSKEPVFSHNDGTILATSVINKKYSDNIDLANARLAAYALQSMDSNVIKDVCIVKNSNNQSEYNFNFADNIKFRAAAKQVFKNNIQLYEAEFIID